MSKRSPAPRHVRSVIADKGFAVRPVFNDCHERGITLIAPLRKEAGDDHSPADRDAFDRDGNPRCKHCGGPTVQVNFAAEPKPRRAHHLTRVRPGSGGSNHTITPKRVGIGCQQLRAHASVILDWLKLLDRMGWLPGSVLRFDLTQRRNRAYARRHPRPDRRPHRADRTAPRRPTSRLGPGQAA